MTVKRQFGKNKIIFGTMASGKSIELIRHLQIYEKFASKLGYMVHIFKPAIDTRKMSRSSTYLAISSRLGGVEFKKHVTAVQCSDEIREYFSQIHGGKHVIAIDEVQMFDSGIIDVIKNLSGMNNHVIVAGLDNSFRGEPMPLADFKATMEDMIDLFEPENRIHLKAVCEVCGDDATFVQRLLNGKPAPYYDPLVVIGDKNIGDGENVRSYEVRCKRHFVVPFKEECHLVRYLLGKKVPEQEIAKLVPDAEHIIRMLKVERFSEQMTLV